MQSARARSRLDDLGGDEAGRLDDAVEPVLGDRGEHRVALGAVAEDPPAQVRERPARRRDRGHDRRRALLRDVAAGEHDQRVGGPRRGRGERADVLALEHGRPAPRTASARRRSAVRSAKQNARCGTRRHSAWTHQPTRPARGPRYSCQYSRDPQLVPVDDEAGSGARARATAAASSEK